MYADMASYMRDIAGYRLRRADSAHRTFKIRIVVGEVRVGGNPRSHAVCDKLFRKAALRGKKAPEKSARIELKLAPELEHPLGDVDVTLYAAVSLGVSD